MNLNCLIAVQECLEERKNGNRSGPTNLYSSLVPYQLTVSTVRGTEKVKGVLRVKADITHKTLNATVVKLEIQGSFRFVCG